MDVCHSLIFFVLTLRDGSTGLVSARLSVYSRIEGENVTVKCSVPSSRDRKVFCKETCDKEDILIETTGASAQRGRYSIDDKDGGLFVTITQLTRSDSGRYRCGAGIYLTRNSYKDFEILVVDAKLDGDPSAEKTIDARTGGNIVVECYFNRTVANMYFCKEECKEEDILIKTTRETDLKDRYSIRYIEGNPTGVSVFVSIKQLTQSDSGRYRCGLGRPNSQDKYLRFVLNVTDETSNQSESSLKTTKGVILYVSLTLVVLVIVSSLSVLVFCRKRTCKDKSEEPEPHEETQCASAPEAEDDPSQHTYSEIKLVSVGSSHGGFHGDAECVIYSVPPVEASSDEPPLYSTVNNPQ
ncbi:polymeric immunoglobulin receptor-like isoform X1 [Pseudochaenichthys georgianus]|uniref:polymeric immunoglobulin receptor-like isoform X1 n=1 Tax=Pseudochaenichthys georgianus TaxID=52239 RepID=UPI00146F5093|nr:polymeric immunoglobulin receptor-like isoform X2 [Pseudochaenichthys georgianus]